MTILIAEAGKNTQLNQLDTMDSKNINPTEYAIAEVSRLAWTRGLDEETIVEIIESAELVQASEGEVVQKAGEQITAVYFVTRGRLWASVYDLFGRKVLEKPIIRGGGFGLFSVASDEDSVVDIKALEPTALVKLSFDELHRLTAKHRDFQLNLYRMAGSQVRQIVMVDRKKDVASTVAIVHQSPATRCLAHRIVTRLAEIEDDLCVVSDDANWPNLDADFAFRSLIENGKPISLEARRQQLKEWSNRGRIFADIGAVSDIEQMSRAMSFVDEVFWCVRPQDIAAAKSMLCELEDSVTGWRDKICLVWVLNSEDYIAPLAPELTSLVDRTFKVSVDQPATNQGNLLNDGLERIIHQLRGIRIGIALGGGAARGMAHLGVLKALEQNGIHIDMIAGTSAGAMTGTVYAYGLDVDYAVESFVNDLRLPWAFRKMPGGGYWYLLYKYRRGQFDPMLRKYMGDARLEQLPIPAYTLTVDLVKGGPVVREQGDAVRGILESINLPGLSSPILGESEALVDGGLVNNIPADVLVAKGCNFVIASSVTAQLEQEFGGVRADEQSKWRRNPSTLQVLLRGQLVQSVNMNAVGVQPADFVIEPDVTAFDLSAFEQTKELAEVGENTTIDAIAQIRQMLSKLDPKLFPA